MRFASWVLVALSSSLAIAQEAGSGVELSGTISVEAVDSHQLNQAPRDGSDIAGGFRAMFYPVWKISEHWAVSAAVQVHSRPYFYDEFSTQGYGVKADVLQANLSYSTFFHRGSVVVRAGELSSAFGSYLLRYDDAVNPLIDRPLTYGYYYEGVSTLSLAGAEADVTLGKLDARAQFVNSSPINRRSIFDRDQYGNWAGGAGYTIRQGFRVGASMYRGPYLDREFPFYFPCEAPPNELPATAVGVDASFGQGPWNLYGEWQRFQMDYHVIPDYVQQAGYVEARRTLTPRWYLAGRAGFLRPNEGAPHRVYEIAAGYRPNRLELVKLSYEAEQGPAIRGTLANTLAVQFVTTFGPLTATSVR
jgi:hypothetical protein